MTPDQPAPETFGLDPERNYRLIAKFRAMDPALLAGILTPVTNEGNK